MRTYLLLLLAFLCAFNGNIAFGKDRILVDKKSATIVFRKIAVPGIRFDEAYVIERSRQFLAQNKDKKLIVFTLVPDETDAKVAAISCDHCNRYPFWRMQYDAIAPKRFPIGELIAFGDNAVLRYRDRLGAVSETVVGGSNPRLVNIGGLNGKIVHVGMQGRMPRPWVELYVVGTGTIDASASMKFIKGLREQIGSEAANVEFRSDPWFINEIWSTWFPLFEEFRGDPPSESEFSATKTLSCWSGRTVNASCSWKSGTETLP
ncbi:MAG: hypothetical protein ABI811_08965 [Acidobacteriota bacterium]